MNSLHLSWIISNPFGFSDEDDTDNNTKTYPSLFKDRIYKDYLTYEDMDPDT
jgi:hypothetical protein